jgi:hypothetical protein
VEADAQTRIAEPDRLKGIKTIGVDEPCSVRVTAWIHPLFDELLACSGFRRWNGVLLLVVELPDGSPGTIRADATDLFATEPAPSRDLVLDGLGVQVLHALVVALRRPRSAAGGNEGK